MSTISLVLKKCLFLLFATLLLTGCKQKNDQNAKLAVDPIEIKNLDLIVDFEQHGLLTPIQIEMLPDNNFAVLDNKTNKVLIFNSEGDLITSFGREGRGPGETIRARQLQVSNDHIFVIDSRLLRINQFNFSGEFIKSLNIDARQGVTIKNKNTYFESVFGKKESLFKKVNLENDSANYMGDALAEFDQEMDLDKERNLLQRGEVPNYTKNTITMYYSDSNLYVFLDAFSQLQKYTLDGDLIWDQPIDMPENEIIFSDVVERAKEMDAPGTVPSFKYITSMKVIDGNTYLFWHPVENLPRKLVKIDTEGNLDAVYHVPEKVPTFSDFTIDAERDLLYLIAPELGQIYRVSVPLS